MGISYDNNSCYTKDHLIFPNSMWSTNVKPTFNIKRSGYLPAGNDIGGPYLKQFESNANLKECLDDKNCYGITCDGVWCWKKSYYVNNDSLKTIIKN
jgi:hypothetical protein